MCSIANQHGGADKPKETEKHATEILRIPAVEGEFPIIISHVHRTGLEDPYKKSKK